MKVVCLLGSPRVRGNSEQLAEEIMIPLQEKGAEIKSYHLNKLTYKGCQACMACKTKQDTCILKDELTEVMNEVKEAEVLILASPVYYGDVTGQMKCFIDRTFEYLVPDYITAEVPSRLPVGKRCAVVLVQGAPSEAQFSDVFPRYKGFLDWYGFSEVHEVRACGVHAKGSVKENEEVLKRAKTVGKALASE